MGSRPLQFNLFLAHTFDIPGQCTALLQERQMLVVKGKHGCIPTVRVQVPRVRVLDKSQVLRDFVRTIFIQCCERARAARSTRHLSREKNKNKRELVVRQSYHVTWIRYVPTAQTACRPWSQPVTQGYISNKELILAQR